MELVIAGSVLVFFVAMILSFYAIKQIFTPKLAVLITCFLLFFVVAGIMIAYVYGM